MQEAAAWPFFEHACVINLDSRPDRWAAMQAQFARLGMPQVQRFPAVAFDNLGEAAPPEALRRYMHSVLQQKGEAGNCEHQVRAKWACLQSHLGVIRHAAQQGWPQVLVIEDDCDFEPYARSVLQRAARQLHGQAWDLLYLGGSLKKGALQQRLSPNVSRVNRIRGNHAYVVKAEHYAAILREAPLAGVPMDVFYSDFYQPRARAVVVEPRVAYQRVNDISDISQQARRAKFNTAHLLRRLCRWAAGMYYGAGQR